MRKLWLPLLAALLLRLCACAYPAHTAEKPAVMVRGALYYMSGEEGADALPEGWLPAGTLENTRDFPRKDMTGLCPDGSEVYVSEGKPEAVYVRMNGSYVCFTAEKLQYAWLMLDGARYLREDDYRKAYPDAPVGSFDGLLPPGAEYRGELRSSGPDAMPSQELRTNQRLFAGWSVYADPLDPEAVYLRREPGASGAIRFLREPAADACSGEPWRDFGMSSAGSPE